MGEMLSIVIPAFNEQENIENASLTIARILENNNIPYEIIYVSDGSKDKTFEKIQECSNNNSCIRGIEFSRNFGKEAAIFAGIDEARGDCCVIMDCDLQHPPEVIPHMYALWLEGYEVVEGIKSNRGKESIFYKMSAGLFYKLISRLMKMDMENTSDFKLIDRKVMKVLTELPERNTFFRALSFWTGFKNTSVEFEVAQRISGQSKWGLKGLIRYAINNITSFSTAPLQLVTVLGMLLLICSFFLGIQTLIIYFMGKSVEGFTTVILLMLLIGGAIMVSLGIIGHYISRIYEEVKQRPRYIVWKRTDDAKNQGDC